MQILLDAPPRDSLIAPFFDAEGHYADTYSVTGEGTLEAFIAAFYTSPLFRLERVVLRVLAKTPSEDAEVYGLAKGTREDFAAWQVEARVADEILLSDRAGRTKSWLAAREGRLWFGSVIVPVERGGRLVLGPVFDSLVGAHKVYSRMLLTSAVQRMKKVSI